MEQLFDILRELINNGFGIWGIIMFVQMRKYKKAQLTHDTVAVYQKIAESNNETLLQQNEKIILLEEKVSRFLAVITRMEECKHYVVCPARPVVQDYKRKYFHVPTRQSRLEQKGQRYPRDNPDIDSRIDNPDGRPP
ncbi:hypothetical protein DW083_20275 [Parabacteroides sp. AF48-14]|uniref:hypothetical protein n=1 Tax=Parabacteroides sp. AF48-14 TaxID=2292052 RepID=UPI000EFE9F96|nr:hypothetical protein [Parabacteroides sp. AF48-14]RHO65711.1 hypothetical protein DW083_20275 [Parabacteroides sp. AF48-14]